MEPHLVCVGKQIVSTFSVLKNLQKLEKMPKLNHFKCAAYRYFDTGNIIPDKLTILQCIIKWPWTSRVSVLVNSLSISWIHFGFTIDIMIFRQYGNLASLKLNNGIIWIEFYVSQNVSFVFLRIFWWILEIFGYACCIHGSHRARWIG